MASKNRPSRPKNYKPTEKENFMSARQREYFRRKLLSWREELLDGSSETLKNMQEESLAEPDMADRASLESDRALELRTRDRQRKLISKIDEALERLEAGEAHRRRAPLVELGVVGHVEEPLSRLRLELAPDPDVDRLAAHAVPHPERVRRPAAVRPVVGAAHARVRWVT